MEYSKIKLRNIILYTTASLFLSFLFISCSETGTGITDKSKSITENHDKSVTRYQIITLKDGNKKLIKGIIPQEELSKRLKVLSKVLEKLKEVDLKKKI